MRGVWARNHKFQTVTKRVLEAALISAVVLIAMTGCASARAGQPGAGTTSATSTAAPTDTPAPTATPRPTPTATLVPFSGKVIRVKNSTAWINGAVSATCPAGTTLLGGGVDNGYGTSDYAGVLSSYPSSTHTWKVIGPASNVSRTLTAIADCLQATRSVTTRIVTRTTPTSSYIISGVGAVSIYDVHCPSGVVTGGGYDVSAPGYVIDSHPDGANGWVSSEFRGSATAYAICSSAPIKVSVVRQTVSYPKYSGSGPAPVVQSTLSCPSGYAALSGGFGEPQSSNVQVGWGSNELASSGQQWIVTGANKSGVAVQTGYTYALCARLS